MTVLFMIIVGLVLGSFSHTVAFRLAHSKPLRSPYSECENCGERLRVRSLIPVLGFLLQKGQSTCCNTAISKLYPIIEGAIALLFGVIAWRLGLTPYSLLLMAWFLGLLIMGLTDYWILHLHDMALFPWLALSALICILKGEWVFGLVGAVFLVIFVIGLSKAMAYLLQKQTMGEGDFYILFGLFLALRSTLTLGIILIGSLTGVILGLLLKKKQLPFVSLMAWGVYVVLLFFSV